MKKASDPTRRPRSSAVRPTVDLPQLREMHKRGQELSKEFGHRGVYISKSRIERAKELNINPAELNKLIAFARGYTGKELEELLRLKTPQRETLSWSHVRKLLTIVDKKERHTFAVSAAKNNWSVQTLSREIDGRRTPKKQGGRKPRDRYLTPATLYELQEGADQMGRLLQAFKGTDPDPHQCLSEKDLAKCRELLPNVEAALVQLSDRLRTFARELCAAVAAVS